MLVNTAALSIAFSISAAVTTAAVANLFIAIAFVVSFVSMYTNITKLTLLHEANTSTLQATSHDGIAFLTLVSHILNRR